ncbi:MAG: threonylcarbamoyl-AMP synthase [Actinobacteria bacterium]|nr:threonylcarbamoyl-AMP synthase [Actinomycetota bacterium]
MIEDAVAAIRDGEIVGVPTDTVYGVAADPANGAALERLALLKGRTAGRPFPVLVTSLRQAADLVEFSAAATRLGTEHWPGPLTLVLRARRDLPVVHDGTIGVRVPDHPAALWLLEVAGPLAVTSANRSGEAAAHDDQEAKAIFGNEVAVYLGGSSPGGTPSTVVDCTVDPPVLLRAGPIG